MNPFDEDKDNADDKKIIKNSKVIIWIEANGRKRTTNISGLLYPETELKEHLKNLKKKHGCNGTVKTVKIAEEEDKLILQFQGDHAYDMETYFKDLGFDDVTVNTI
jgi:translation initiation factor 1 (eIF-1/SUI1)